MAVRLIIAIGPDAVNVLKMRRQYRFKLLGENNY